MSPTGEMGRFPLVLEKNYRTSSGSFRVEDSDHEHCLERREDPSNRRHRDPRPSRNFGEIEWHSLFLREYSEKVTQRPEIEGCLYQQAQIAEGASLKSIGRSSQFTIRPVKDSRMALRLEKRTEPKRRN